MKDMRENGVDDLFDAADVGDDSFDLGSVPASGSELGDDEPAKVFESGFDDGDEFDEYAAADAGSGDAFADELGDGLASGADDDIHGGGLALSRVPRAGSLAPRRVPKGVLAINPTQVAAEYEAILAAKRHARQGAGAGAAADDRPAGADGATPSAADDLGLAEQIVDSRRAWQGDYLSVDAVEVRLPDGGEAVREVVRHPGAVAVIALDGRGRILLVRQYRTALERVTREIPAGKMEPGESAEDAARRELSEETGYTAASLRYLIPVATAAGYSDEIIHLFMATDLQPGEQHADDDEFVACEWVDLSDFVDEVLDGKVEDAKTIIAAFACDAIAHRL